MDGSPCAIIIKQQRSLPSPPLPRLIIIMNNAGQVGIRFMPQWHKKPKTERKQSQILVYGTIFVPWVKSFFSPVVGYLSGQSPHSREEKAESSGLILRSPTTTWAPDPQILRKTALNISHWFKIYTSRSWRCCLPGRAVTTSRGLASLPGGLLSSSPVRACSKCWHHSDPAMTS